MSDMGFEIVDADWARELEAGCIEYLDACMESLEIDEHFVTITEEVFCGCSVCYSREQLAYLTPRIIEAYNNGQVILTGENNGD